MEDIHNFYRLIGLYFALHIILFIVELYKYKHSIYSWNEFKNEGMYGFTYLLIFFDMLMIFVLILAWALWPLVN